MTEPLIDVTIAVHSASRPIARAVASVLDYSEAPVRVTVVAHNIDSETIRRNLGSYATHPQLRVSSLRDGIASPAGPMNHGFSISTAPFITVMGSDDELAPGALDSWLELQRETGAEAVLARIQLADGRSDPYPPVRAGRRTRNLSGRKDRLAYRSAPLGLIDRRRFGDLRLTEGLSSGEDLTYSLTIWFTGQRLAYDLSGPAYIVRSDAVDRVTSTARPVAHDFAYLDELENLAWFNDAPKRVREAIVIKLIRIHVFDAIMARTRTADEFRASRTQLIDLIARLSQMAPGALRFLSRADRFVFDALEDPSVSADTVSKYCAARRSFRSPAALLTRNPLHSLHSQAPFRTLLAGWRIMRRVYPVTPTSAQRVPSLSEDRKDLD